MFYGYDIGKNDSREELAKCVYLESYSNSEGGAMKKTIILATVLCLLFGSMVFGAANLFEYIKIGDFESLKTALEEGAKISERYFGYNLLGYAFEYGASIKMIELIIDSGVDPESEGNTMIETTPLYMACEKGRLDVVTFLHEKYGVDLHSPCTGGMRYPILAALESGNIELIEYLLNKGANVRVFHKNKYASDDYSSPIQAAAYYGYFDIFKIILEKGASAHETSNSGYSPLELAISQGRTEIAFYLIEELGVDISKRDRHGFTPLYFAIKSDWIQMTEYLLEKGANPNLRLKDGSTLLHMSVEQDNFAIALLLLEYGAETTLKNSQGKTPKMLAEEKGLIGIVEHLETFELKE